MSRTPEKVLAKFWEKEEVMFWMTMATAAPNPDYARRYQNMAALVGIDKEVASKLQGQHVIRGVASCKLICPACHTVYDNCAEDTDTYPSFCGCKFPYPRLVTPQAVGAVATVVFNHMLKKGMFSMQ